MQNFDKRHKTAIETNNEAKHIETAEKVEKRMKR
jgi:hypothetical protein